MISEPPNPPIILIVFKTLAPPNPPITRVIFKTLAPPNPPITSIIFKTLAFDRRASQSSNYTYNFQDFGFWIYRVIFEKIYATFYLAT